MASPSSVLHRPVWIFAASRDAVAIAHAVRDFGTMSRRRLYAKFGLLAINNMSLVCCISGVHLYRLFIDDTGAGAARAVQAALSKVSTSEPLPLDSPPAGASDDGVLHEEANALKAEDTGRVETLFTWAKHAAASLQASLAPVCRQRGDGGQQRGQRGGGCLAYAAPIARPRALRMRVSAAPQQGAQLRRLALRGASTMHTACFCQHENFVCACSKRLLDSVTVSQGCEHGCTQHVHIWPYQTTISDRVACDDACDQHTQSAQPQRASPGLRRARWAR